MDTGTEQGREGPQGAPMSSIVARPLVVLGALCVVPLAVSVAAGGRLMRGQWRGLGRDAVAVARATTAATRATLGALADRR